MGRTRIWRRDMSLVKKYQNNFTTGVMSPSAYARVDLSKYSSGCKRIVNGIVHAHGGTITAHNLPQGGAEFLFRLPLTNTHPNKEVS